MDEKQKNTAETIFKVLSLVFAALPVIGFTFTPKEISDFLYNNLWISFLSIIIGCVGVGFFIGQAWTQKKLNTHNDLPEVKPYQYGSELIESINNIIDNIKDDTKQSFIGLFKGWLRQLNAEINNGGNQTFDIDSNYYAACLIEIESEDVLAIADLTNPIENFWLENAKPIGTQVKQRIFLIDWRDFFDDAKLESYIKLFRTNKQLYDIRVGHVPLHHDNALNNFPDRIGCDVFIGKGNLVGGYIKHKNRVFLRMTRNDISHKQALSKYNSFKENSLEFKLEWSATDLRKEWLKHNKYGYWKKDWVSIVQDRTEDYFNSYDIHIRCWIPKYDRFIQGCFELVRLEAIQLTKGKEDKVKILEIGFGTGALATKILGWLHQFDKPMQGISKSIYYYGIDPAKDDMLRHSNYDISEKEKEKYFLTGFAFDDLHPKIISERPFDIIVASLVLHDLNTENPNPNFEIQLKHFSQLLKTNGKVVIADLFDTKNRKQHKERFDYWNKFLNSNLSEEGVKFFYNSNRDMIGCIKEEDVVTLAERNGFKAVFENIRNGSPNSPFKYLILTKK